LTSFAVHPLTVANGHQPLAWKWNGPVVKEVNKEVSKWII